MMSITPRVSGYTVLIIAVVAVVASADVASYIFEKPSEPVTPTLNRPNQVVKVYLNAAKKGEIVVFDRVIMDSMLVPLRVEYIYILNEPTSKVKVYSKLKNAIYIDKPVQCRIYAISSTLDTGGNIIETEAHVWPGE